MAIIIMRRWGGQGGSWFWRYSFLFLFCRHALPMELITIPAYIMLGIWIAIQVINISMVINDSGGGVV
jgi:hypothetical protein